MGVNWIEFEGNWSMVGKDRYGCWGECLGVVGSGKGNMLSGRETSIFFQRYETPESRGEIGEKREIGEEKNIGFCIPLT
jgi:hypothetical protein